MRKLWERSCVLFHYANFSRISEVVYDAVADTSAWI